MKVVTTITADLKCEETPRTIYVKQWDADTRVVRVYFRDGGEEFDLNDVFSAQMHVLKPDGKMTSTDGSFHGGEYIDFTFSDQSLSVAGEGRAEFILYGAYSRVISTIAVPLVIYPQAYGDEAAASTNEFRDLLNRIAALETYAARFVITTKTAYDEGSKRADTVYFVLGGETAAAYIGEIPIGAASVPSMLKVRANLNPGMTAELTIK